MKGWQKPQALISDIIDKHMNVPGGYILDAMCGTGTTSVCAVRKGMNVVAFDADFQTSMACMQRMSRLPDGIGPQEELCTKAEWTIISQSTTEVSLLVKLDNKKNEKTQAVDLTASQEIGSSQVEAVVPKPDPVLKLNTSSKETSVAEETASAKDLLEELMEDTQNIAAADADASAQVQSEGINKSCSLIPE